MQEPKKDLFCEKVLMELFGMRVYRQMQKRSFEMQEPKKDLFCEKVLMELFGMRFYRQMQKKIF